jgi:hypothetical protein
MKWEYHFYQAGSGRDFEQAEETMNPIRNSDGRARSPVGYLLPLPACWRGP